MNWSLVDRGPGASPRYDWSVIDQLIAPWRQAGKVVNLLLNNSGYQHDPLQGVPTWLQSQLRTVTCGTSVAPVYWDPAFLSAWQGYVAAVVDHYAGDPNVGYIHVGVATGAQTLVVGVNNPPCLAQWNAAGYETQWPVYVSQMISFVGGLHSPKQLIVSFNDYANAPPASTIIQQDAAQQVGFGFDGLQASDAAALSSGQPCGKTNWCALYEQYASKAPAFVQTLGQSYPGPEVGTTLQPDLRAAETTGPLPPLLQTALAVHTQIFEIYSQDLLLTFDPSTPGYGQDHATYAQAFADVVASVGTPGGVAAATS